MNCQEVMELMQRYLDQDLDDTDMQAMTEHVLDCPACAAMFERLKHLSSELEKLPKVFPAFSLVDGILPRLEQIDRLNAAEALVPKISEASVANESSNKALPQSQRFKKRFTYKIVGSVIAAGILLALMIVNSKPFTSSQLADNILTNPLASKQSSESAASEERAEFSAAQDSAKEAEAAEPAQSVQEAPKAESPDIPVPSSDEEMMKVAEMDAADQAESSPEGGSSQGFAGSVETVEPDELKSQDTRELERAMMAPDSQSKSSASEQVVEDEPVEAAAESKKTGEPDTQFSLEIMASEKVSSNNGNYVAFVEDRKVVIANKDNKRVYESPKKQADRISNLKWSDDSRFLEYEAAAGESVQAYIIDVENKTETVK